MLLQDYGSKISKIIISKMQEPFVKRKYWLFFVWSVEFIPNCSNTRLDQKNIRTLQNENERTPNIKKVFKGEGDGGGMNFFLRGTLTMLTNKIILVSSEHMTIY